VLEKMSLIVAPTYRGQHNNSFGIGYGPLTVLRDHIANLKLHGPRFSYLFLLILGVKK